jgi:hypothetical protein
MTVNEWGGGPPRSGSGGSSGPRSDTGTPKATAELSAKAVDTIDLVVTTVKDKAIRPLVLAARAVVFGILIVVLGVVVVVVGAVGFVRLLDVYAFGGRVWAADALLGTLFVVAGLLAWSRRSTPATGSGR